MKIVITHIVFYCLYIFSSYANSPSPIVTYNDSNEIIRAGKFLGIYEDSTNKLNIQDVINLDSFTAHNQDIPSFGLSKSTFWAKLSIDNKTTVEDFILEFEKVTATELILYTQNEKTDSTFIIQNVAGTSSKKYTGRLYLFDFKIPKQQQRTLYIKFKTNWGFTFPVKIASREKMLHRLFNEELIGGVYIGILFIMVLYNMFIYFSIRDKSYIYYVIYIFSFLLFQFNEMGYAYKYFFYLYPEYFSVATKILPTATSISAIIFIRDFLKTKTYAPLLDKGFNVFLIVFFSIFLLIFREEHNSLFFSAINTSTLSVSLYTLVVAIYIVSKGFTPAKFFLIAWSVLLLSIIQVNLSNLGFIPYYNITDHSLELGSVIEIVLLSLGLAYRINVLKKEKEASQVEALTLVKEKKNIIENQNYALENLVKERTRKLELRNKIISEKNEEKSIMMREIHHRVKNNLQMINSMVRLQSRFINEDNAIDSLKKVERRILTMAHLHEKMYQSENLKSINIQEYISNIIKDLFLIYNDDENVEYILEIQEIDFKMETALYLGLLLNELIINSLKHAFSKNKKGIININLRKLKNNTYSLKVTDNGIGFDINNFSKSKSLGQRLINNFVKQLKGELIIKNNNGAEFKIVFEEI